MSESTNSAYTIATVNTKGGVGKSTISANIAALCADLGQRVLMIDCDKVVGTLSRYFPLVQPAPYGISHALLQRSIDGSCISHTNIEGLDIVCRDPGMEAALIELSAEFNAPFILDQAIAQLRDSDIYDLIIIDTPGATGLAQDIGIVPADLIISPVVPETLAAREVEPLLQLLRRYERGMPNSRQSAVQYRPIITRATNTTDARQLTSELRQMFLSTRGRFNVCNTVIPHSALFAKASTANAPVHHIEPRRGGQLGPISQLFHALVGELLPHLLDQVAHELQSDDSTTDAQEQS
jgi:chromosome partitioning related protein ParA